jgi:hypothetical protein
MTPLPILWLTWALQRQALRHSRAFKLDSCILANLALSVITFVGWVEYTQPSPFLAELVGACTLLLTLLYLTVVMMVLKYSQGWPCSRREWRIPLSMYIILYGSFPGLILAITSLGWFCFWQLICHKRNLRLDRHTWHRAEIRTIKTDIEEAWAYPTAMRDLGVACTKQDLQANTQQLCMLWERLYILRQSLALPFFRRAASILIGLYIFSLFEQNDGMVDAQEIELVLLEETPPPQETGAQATSGWTSKGESIFSSPDGKTVTLTFSPEDLQKWKSTTS